MTAAPLKILVLVAITFALGCSRSGNPELEQARLEADEARQAAEQARDELVAAKATVPKPVPMPAGLRIWRDTDAEELCRTLGIEADCFRYEGGWVSSWVEIDVDGKKTRWGEDEAVHQAALNKQRKEAVSGSASGTIVWVRRTEGSSEAWDLAFKSKIKTAKGIASSDSKITLGPPDGPPQPSAPGIERHTRGAASVLLKDGEEETLITLMTSKEKEGTVTRTVKLKCKALK